jgi:hypothetical protein
MDLPTMIGIGVAAGLGAYLATRSQHKSNAALAPSIMAALQAQDALTLPALTDAIGLKGFSARGKVMMALNNLVREKKVRIIPAPDGTPQLQKVNFIKYALAA